MNIYDFSVTDNKGRQVSLKAISLKDWSIHNGKERKQI